MKVINITEEQRDALQKELARLTFEIKKDPRVVCIYFAPYKALDSMGRNTMVITVAKEKATEEDQYNMLDKQNDYFKSFGMSITIVVDDASEYNIIDYDASVRRRSNDLMNSVILYDKSGEFSRIKEKTAHWFSLSNENGVYYYYDNLAEIYPPLDINLNTLNLVRKK